MDPISLSLVSAGRGISEPRVAPGGGDVAFVQRWGGAASINVVALSGGQPERQLTFGIDPAPGRGFGAGCFVWVTLPHHDRVSFVYVGVDGELWWQRALELDRVTDHEGRGVRAPASADGGRSVVYAVDEAEIWMLDLSTGQTQRIDDGRHEFCFDPAIAPDARTVSWTGWSPPDMAWDRSVRVDATLAPDRAATPFVTGIHEWTLDDAAFQQPRFTPSGEAAHVHDGSGWLNVHIGGEPVIAESIEHAGPTWGMGNRSFAFSPDGSRMAFTRNERGHGALCVADRATGEVHQVGRGVHGQLSWAGEQVVALRSGARTPPEIVAYQSPDWTRSAIACSQPVVWPREELPEPELVESGTDATVLHARRYVAGHGRMLVWVHGGPTDQWQVDWRPRILYWWSRGWDVLVVDPRGTTGHGRAYQQALHGRWGRVDVDDTAALIDHAHRSGWATPESTVVIGGSSGGLTALGVLADHPGLVAGGITSYPVSDLRALTEATHRFEAHYTDTLVGPNDDSPASNAAFIEHSPVHRVERITTPVLLMHGSDDQVVPIAQSEELVAKLRAAGGDVEFVVYDGEGHGFRRVESVRDEYARTEAFLDRVVHRG